MTVPTPHVPFAADNFAAVRHGAFSSRLVAWRAAELREQLAAAPWVQASDTQAVEHLVSLLARFQLLDEHIWSVADENGVAAVRPYLWTELSRVEGNLWKALNDLGLTPAGRGKLARDLGVAHHFAGGLQELGAQGRELRQSRGRI